jgi:hypothetical protein
MAYSATPLVEYRTSAGSSSGRYGVSRIPCHASNARARAQVAALPAGGPLAGRERPSRHGVGREAHARFLQQVAQAAEDDAQLPRDHPEGPARLVMGGTPVGLLVVASGRSGPLKGSWKCRTMW